jgi:hypothetical protein
MISREEKIQQRPIEEPFEDREQGQTTPPATWRRRWQDRELAEGVGLRNMNWKES